MIVFWVYILYKCMQSIHGAFSLFSISSLFVKTLCVYARPALVVFIFCSSASNEPVLLSSASTPTYSNLVRTYFTGFFSLFSIASKVVVSSWLMQFLCVLVHHLLDLPQSDWVPGYLHQPGVTWVPGPAQYYISIGTSWNGYYSTAIPWYLLGGIFPILHMVGMTMFTLFYKSQDKHMVMKSSHTAKLSAEASGDHVMMMCLSCDL